MTKQQVIISSRTDAELINDWVATENMEVTQEVATIRGWLMDELEKRFPVEFNRYLENCMTDDDIRNYIPVIRKENK